METVSVCGSSVDLKKVRHFYRGMICVEALVMSNAGKLQECKVNALYISALKVKRLLFLFVLLMYLFHSVRALSMEYVCMCQMCSLRNVRT